MNLKGNRILKKSNLIFLMSSETVNIEHYTIKDIPGSSGRLDVIARAILAALINDNKFDMSVQIVVFFKKYGAYCFDPDTIDYSTFPKDELQLSDAIYRLIKSRNNIEELRHNPLSSIKKFDLSMIDYIKTLLRNGEKDIFVLKESSKKFSSFLEIIHGPSHHKNLVFVVGNQSEDLINSERFLSLGLEEISLGSKAYLASSVIRLVKLRLLTL